MTSASRSKIAFDLGPGTLYCLPASLSTGLAGAGRLPFMTRSLSGNGARAAGKAMGEIVGDGLARLVAKLGGTGPGVEVDDDVLSVAAGGGGPAEDLDAQGR